MLIKETMLKTKNIEDTTKMIPTWIPTKSELLAIAERWIVNTRHCKLTIRVPMNKNYCRSVLGFGTLGKSCGVIVIEPEVAGAEITRVVGNILDLKVGGEWYVMAGNQQCLNIASAVAVKTDVGIIKVHGNVSRNIVIERASKVFDRDYHKEIGLISQSLRLSKDEFNIH